VNPDTSGCYNRPMNIENPPIFQGVNLGSVEDPGRPVLSLDWSAEGPHNVAGHVHTRAQIIYQRTGVYRVNTAQGNWVVPPSQAIWIPSMVYHETFTNNSASALMLFVDRRYTGVLPQECMVVGVSPLLSELFIRAAKYGNDYPPSGREARLVQVMLDEFGGLQPAPLNLPLAADNRVRRILDLLIAEPGENRGIDQLALACGASSRTLSRLFRKGKGKEAKLCFMGHVVTENRHGLVVAARTTLATGTAEREASVAMMKRLPRGRRSTLGGDKGYDTQAQVRDLRKLGVTPHVAQNDKGRSSAVDDRTTTHVGYEISQRKRKAIEQVFGWGKTVGPIRKTKHRGRDRVGWMFTFTQAAYNLVRMRNLLCPT